MSAVLFRKPACTGSGELNAGRDGMAATIRIISDGRTLQMSYYEDRNLRAYEDLKQALRDGLAKSLADSIHRGELG